MIFVTGDTHVLQNYNKLVVFAQNNPYLTKNDYVIIAGDFGGLWKDDSALIKYSELPFTILFADGNHENFDLINSYPTSKWNGGNVHIIAPDIIHLMRGQVFEIEGKKIFIFGGATSRDKDSRLLNNLGWWKEETPTYEELSIALQNLSKHNNSVDYIITHACDKKSLLCPPLSQYGYPCYQEHNILSCIDDVAKYRRWFFGHYHMDCDLPFAKTLVYNNIIQLT